MLVMSASVNRLRLAAIVLIMVLILTITILPSADNAHYVRNDGAWKLKRKTITFGSVEKHGRRHRVECRQHQSRLRHGVTRLR